MFLDIKVVFHVHFLRAAPPSTLHPPLRFLLILRILARPCCFDPSLPRSPTNDYSIRENERDVLSLKIGMRGGGRGPLKGARSHHSISGNNKFQHGCMGNAFGRPRVHE